MFYEWVKIIDVLPFVNKIILYTVKFHSCYLMLEDVFPLPKFLLLCSAHIQKLEILP